MGLVLMVATVAGAYWMLTDKTFDLDAPRVTGELRFVDGSQAVATALGSQQANTFQVRTDEIRGQLLADPAIADAAVTVTLPNRLDVALSERTPVFALARGNSAMLVDATGIPIALVDLGTAQQLSLPIVTDDRSAPPALYLGQAIDPIDLAAILQLGAVTPTLVDSGATSLALSVRDNDGFVLTAQPQGWQAIFGQYTPNLRPTDIIARQVQCLRSLIDASESDLQTVYLAPLDERCGTYLPNATPVVATPAPTKAR